MWKVGTKQSGGRGQYGHVFSAWSRWLLETGSSLWRFCGSVPRQYIPQWKKASKKPWSKVLAGYPVVDVRVTLYDGSYHSVDSSEMAFKIAASMAFKMGFMDAQPILSPS